jgi:AraC-like DNA-binding protein
VFRAYFLIYIIVASHSFVVAVLLFSRRTNREANAYLGAINVVIGVFAVMAFWSFETDFRFGALFVYLILPAIYLTTPLIYLYATKLMKLQTERDWFHFIPAICAAVYSLVRAATTGPRGLADAGDVFTLHYVPEDTYFVLQAGLLLMIGYTVQMLLLLRQYNRQIRARLSTVARTDLGWLRVQLTIGVVGVTVIFVTNVVQYLTRDRGGPDLLWLEYLGLATIVVFLLNIVYFTFRQSETRAPGSTPRYTRQRLGEAVESGYVKRLVEHMEASHPYLDPELTIDDLADELDLPSAHLTMVLNLHLGRSFYQFVNGYRVRRAAEILRDPANADRGVLDIAYESGFNSKTSFNTNFKREMGTTPREYRATALGAGDPGAGDTVSGAAAPTTPPPADQ